MNMSDICHQMRRVGNPATCKGVKDVYRLTKEKHVHVIGRNSLIVDFYINSSVHPKLISREHAVITIATTENDERKISIHDKSVNGTFVNDEKIQGTVPLFIGDTVTFGHLQGIRVKPWEVAKQLNSEFRFQIERVNSTPDVISDVSPARKPLADVIDNHNQTDEKPCCDKETERENITRLNALHDGRITEPSREQCSPRGSRNPDCIASISDDDSEKSLAKLNLNGQHMLQGARHTSGRDYSSKNSANEDVSKLSPDDISQRQHQEDMNQILCNKNSQNDDVSLGRLKGCLNQSLLKNVSRNSHTENIGQYSHMKNSSKTGVRQNSHMAHSSGNVQTENSKYISPNSQKETSQNSHKRDSQNSHKGNISHNEHITQIKEGTVQNTHKKIINHGPLLKNGSAKVLSPSILPPSNILPRQLILGVPACRVQAVPQKKFTSPKRNFCFPSLETIQNPFLPTKMTTVDSDKSTYTEDDSMVESDEDIFAITSKVKSKVERLVAEEEDEDSFSPKFPSLSDEKPLTPLTRNGSSLTETKINTKVHNIRRRTIPLAGMKSVLSTSASSDKTNSRKRKSDGVLPSAKKTMTEIEVCAAVKCLRPAGIMIPWVQCDDCDLWFHTNCAGCKFEDVRKSSAAFRCGCL